MKRTTAGPAALALAAALAGGCGEDAPSKPEYVKKANAICKRFNRQIERQAEKSFAGLRDESELTPARARAFFETALPKYRRTVDDLKALEPPEGDKETVEKIYAAAEQEGDKIEGDIKSDRKVRALVSADSVTPKFEKLSKDYGLNTCAED